MSSRPRRTAKQLRVLRRRGWVRKAAGPYIDKVRALHAQGMTPKMMAQQTGLSTRAFRNLVAGGYRYQGEWRDFETVHPSTAYAVNRLRYQPVEPDAMIGGHGARMNPVGTQRRIQALLCAGWPLRTQSREMLGRAQRSDTAERVLARRQYVFASTAMEWAEAYEKYKDADPMDFGVDLEHRNEAANRARRLGFAPASCWDPDTIDDPDAIPEWTGRCGTPFGVEIHKREGIPLCSACSVAHGSASVEISPERLVYWRERRGMSRDELSDAAGVKKDTIRSWEIGRTQPRFTEALGGLMSALDVTLEDIRKEETNDEQ